MPVLVSGVAQLLLVVGITYCFPLVGGIKLNPSKASDNVSKLQASRRESAGDDAMPPTCARARVFNLGLPRTGTESFCEYGESLGYQANHQRYSQDITPDRLHMCVEDASRCLDLFGTEDPEYKDMFCDHPVPGIGCQLASAFPTAAFVLMTRSFEKYYPSARFWMCRWGASKVCPGNMERSAAFSMASHVELYSRAYETFCDKALNSTNLEALCGDDDGESEEQAWSDMGLAELVKQMHQEHDSKVQKCVPSDRLLVLDLEMPDKAQRIGSFLGCSGQVPEYPHAHWYGVNQKGTVK